MRTEHETDRTDLAASDPAGSGSEQAGGNRWIPSNWLDRDPEEPAGVSGLIRIFWRQRWLMLATVIGLTALCGVLVKQLEPRYTAASLVMFNAPQAQVVTSESIKDQLSVSPEALQGQIEIIRSYDLAAKVVDRLDLVVDPEFKAEEGIGFADQVSGVFKAVSTLLSTEEATAILGERFSGLLTSAFAGVLQPSIDTSQLSPPEMHPSELVVERKVIDQFLDRLTVEQQGQSQVISIAFTSKDPGTAQSIANGIADAYLDAQIEQKTQITESAVEWLEKRLTDLRRQAEESERRVETLRTELGMDRQAEVSLVMQTLSELNAQLQIARADRREANVRVRKAQSLMQSSGGAESAAEVLDSLLVQRLREQEAMVTREVREMSVDLGANHPRMVVANAELEDIRQRIKDQIERIVAGLRNELDVATARERSLEESVADLHAKAVELSGTQVELTLAEGEALANRSLYESFLARTREISSQIDFQQPDAQIVSYASLPIKPSFPRVHLVLLVGFLGASFTSVFLAIARDHFTHIGFRTSRQAERCLGMSVLGLVPDVSRLGGSPHAPVVHMLDKPSSAFAEAVRQISLKLTLGEFETDPDRAKVVLVTSALAAEGKTSTAVCLARQRAALGKKVVLVDADLWRPRVHQVCKVERSPGLIDHLARGEKISELVKPDPASPIHLITAGEQALDAGELIASRRMADLMDELGSWYDCVVIDSAPVLAVAATRVLARLAGRTVLVTRWERTRREVALAATRELLHARASLAGVILTMVDPKQSASYSYSDAAYSQGAMRSYYRD
jgi:capsular exopolysaccharide synthesis family protein